MLIGNVGQDPELRYTPDGNPVANFSIAVNRRRKALSFKNGMGFKMQNLPNFIKKNDDFSFTYALFPSARLAVSLFFHQMEHWTGGGKKPFCSSRLQRDFLLRCWISFEKLNVLCSGLFSQLKGSLLSIKDRYQHGSLSDHRMSLWTQSPSKILSVPPHLPAFLPSRSNKAACGTSFQ